MRARTGTRLTYANVVSTLCLFLVLGGGTAWAANEWTGRNIVNGSLTTVDYRDNDIRSADVRNDNVLGGGLTGADIRDQSGVDTCVRSIRIGQLCARAENSHRTWQTALDHCTNIGLRLPSLSEAVQLVKSGNVPNLDPAEDFWTDSLYAHDFTDYSYLVGNTSPATYALSAVSGRDASTAETLCVTTPTN